MSGIRHLEEVGEDSLVWVYSKTGEKYGVHRQVMKFFINYELFDMAFIRQVYEVLLLMITKSTNCFDTVSKSIFDLEKSELRERILMDFGHVLGGPTLRI